MASKHPGFQKVAQSMARKQCVSTATASKELAASTRRAGAAAKKANPRLKNVK